MRQLIRYGLLGVATNIAAYSVYLLITYVGFESKQTMTLMYFAGAIIGFVGNRKWTFSHEGSHAGAALRYAIAHFFGYAINYTMLFLLVDHMGYKHQLVQALAILTVAAFLFVAFKYYVFRNRVN